MSISSALWVCGIGFCGTMAASWGSTAHAAQIPAPPAVLSDRAHLEVDFDQASRDFGVPSNLLRAIAYVESRWHHSIPEESDAVGAEAPHQRAYGVMGLRDDDWFGHSLRQSAALIGQTPETLILDPRANIRGAAAYLRSLKASEGEFLDWGSLRSEAERLVAWIPALKKYSGMPSPEDAAQYTNDVFEVLRDGESRNGIFIARAGGGFPLTVFAERPQSAGGTSSEYPDADWDPSPNITPNGIQVSHIIIHDTEGSFAGSVSWLKNPAAQVSAHFVIRSRDGYMKQLVHLQDKAWHARCWNSFSIGIEHEGFMDNPDYYTPEMYQSSAKLVTFLTGKFNIPVTPSRIVGHDFRSSVYFPASGMVDCNTHTDPGMFWDWEGYFALLGLTSLPSP